MSTKTSKVRPDVDDQGPSLPPQTSMALTATFTADECISHINTYAQRACMNLKVNLGGFNQVIQNLLDPNSVFYQTSDHAGGANVALVRACDIGTSEDGFQDLVAALKSYHANPKATRNVVLLLVPQMQKTPSEWDGLNDAVASCNKVVVVPTSEIIRCVGGWHNDLFDPETDKLGAMPYTVEGYRRLGLMIVRVINYLTRLPTKVIAVDCDNTLWKGIAGDTGGADEVQGNLVLMHLLAKRQKENGMLLATFSKNAEPDVKAAFDAHPDWPLKYDDFVAHFVNWEPKGANLRRCAEQLNLGLDSFTFMDDNPVEIAQVESSCPEISMTLHFPNSTDSTPEEIEAFVNTAWPLDAFRMALQADSEKTSQYKAEAQRKAAALATPSTTFAGFIATLNLNIQIAACSTQDEARCLQLSQKSNQFNFTTKRLSVFPPLPMECSVTRVKDKYGDYGLVGVMFYSIVGENLVLDNFLMSCRVLGRGVEHQMIAELGKIAQTKGCNTVEIAFARSGRNMPAGTFLNTVNLFPTAANEDVDIGVTVSKAFPSDVVAACMFDPEQASDYGATKGKVKDSSAVDVVLTSNNNSKIDFTGIAREEAKTTTKKNSSGGGSSQNNETKTADDVDAKAACLDALSTVLGDDAAAAAAADGDRSIYSLGLDSLMMVRIVGKLKRTFPRFPNTVTPTDMQRGSTLNQWVALLSGNAKPKTKHDECMFKIKGNNAPGKATLVFLHPAGGAIGPFNKMFKSMGDDREIWGIEHPYFVNEEFDPRVKTLGETGTVYADAIINKLSLEDKPGTGGTSSKKWVLVTYSAGGLWLNETFHQLRMRGNAPHLVVLLDAGWGIVTGPWDYPICCGGSCCCRMGCAPAPLCEPCYSCCEGMFAAIQWCWTPCQKCRYHARNPARNPNQPLTYNDVYKGPPMGESTAVGMLDQPYDFFRLGFEGRIREEPNPVQMIMTRDPPLATKTTKAATAKVRQYMDDEFGPEGQGAKFERMAAVMMHGTMAHLFSVKAVPFGDTPLAVYQEKRPMMRTIESVYQTQDYNVVDQEKFVTNLNLEGFEEIFKKEPPPNRAHQLFTSDDAVVAKILDRMGKVMEKMEL